MECGICKKKMNLVGNKKMRKEKYLMIKCFTKNKISDNLFNYLLSFLGEGVFYYSEDFILMLWNCPNHETIRIFLLVFDYYVKKNIQEIQNFFLYNNYNNFNVFSFFENINVKIVLNSKHDNYNMNQITFFLNEMFIFFYKEYKTKNIQQLINLVDWDRKKMISYYFKKRFNLINNTRFK